MNTSRRKHGVIACAVLAALCSVAGCKGKKQPDTKPALTAEAMFARAMDQMGRGKMRHAVETFRQVDLGYTPKSRDRLEPLVRLGMADATFYQGGTLNQIAALGLYQEFATLFSTHPLAAYAQFQIGVCHLAQAHPAPKDQSQTHAALNSLLQVERGYPQSAWVRPALQKIREAEARLAEHEFLVARFYMKRKTYLAAVDRLRNLIDDYPDYAEREKVYFYLGRAYLLADNDVEGRLYLDKLVTDFPRGKYVKQARKALDQAGGPLQLGVDATPK